MNGLEAKLKLAMSAAFQTALGDELDEAVDPLVHSSQHADYQADAALGLAKKLKRKPRDIAGDVISCIDSPLVGHAEIAGPGFINLRVSDDALGAALTEQFTGERCGVDTQLPKTIVVDYSAPNVAKEMHVGHLRSTIIGDACVRLMEWLGHDVVRRNHIGDWGTPFGMLIEHLLDLGETEATKELSVGDLNAFYKTARKKFDASEEFQERARQRVVSLQSGDAETLRLWHILIEQSQSYFLSVYAKLDVRLEKADFFGESAYNDDLLPTLNELAEKGLISKSDGADCLFPEGFTNREDQPLPLIVRKQDGGFGYAATDLACIRNRLREIKANRILYVVGAPQRQHFQMIFTAAKMAGWLTPAASAEHIAFGSVLGSDGKMFASRSGDTIKLADLLAEAVARAKATVDEKNPDIPEAEREKIAEAVGIGAIKYADLSSERTRDYEFNFDRMLAFEGRTAPYLQYAHARIHSILRQTGGDSRTHEFLLKHDEEHALAIQLNRFPDVIDDVSQNLLFHKLAAYLFDLASTYSSFYAQCPVLQADNASERGSRLRLSYATAQTLATGLAVLGIRAPAKM